MSQVSCWILLVQNIFINFVRIIPEWKPAAKASCRLATIYGAVRRLGGGEILHAKQLRLRI